MMMNNINIDDFPDVLLVEILCRLACKKLVFQCKCVSKRWGTLISNPYFIGRFVRLQIDKKGPITGGLLNPRGMDIHTQVLSPVFRRLMTFHGLTEEPFVVATYNDLVLCCASQLYQREYYICNPYTRQWVALPPSCHQEYRYPIPVGFICDIPYYNYNEEDDDGKGHIIRVNSEYRCKVVRILPPPDQEEFKYNQEYGSFIFNVEMFSFETGEWRVSVVSSPIQFWPLNHMFSFAYNGMVYWSIDDGKGHLLGLDPFMIKVYGEDAIDYNKCRIVEYCGPSNIPNCFVDIGQYIGVYGGCLRMGGTMMNYNLSNEGIIIFDMKEEPEDGHDQMVNDGGNNFCVKKIEYYVLDEAMFEGRFNLYCPIVFDPSNEDILYVVFGFSKEVIRCNTRTGEWSKFIDKLDTESYFYSFVFPWWPTPVPRLPQHVRT